jgi:ketosteroid isomerase-like protein
MSGHYSSVEAVVAELSNKVATAAEAMDVETFANLLADDYMSVDFDGKTHNKADRVAEWRAQDFKASSVKVSDHKVRVYGTTAIATGVATVKAQYNGKDISGEYRFTQVFGHRSGSPLSDSTKSGDLQLTHSTGVRMS